MSGIDIDGYVSRLDGLQSNANKLSGLLAPIIQKTSDGELLLRDTLEKAFELMRSHSERLDDFEAEMKRDFPDAALDRYDEVRDFLKSQRDSSYEFALEALERFQRVRLKNVDGPEGEKLLAQCREKAGEISKMADIQEIISLSGPYRLFVDIVSGKIPTGDITDEREDVLREKFGRALFRFLLARDFFIDASGSKYNYVTEEYNGSFSIRELEKSFSKKTVKEFITNLNWFTIISEEQMEVKRVFSPQYQSIAKILLKKGYLTRIESKAAACSESYCLSGKWLQVKEANDYFRSVVDSGLSPATDEELRKNEDSIEKIVCYNDFILFLQHGTGLKGHCSRMRIVMGAPNKRTGRLVEFKADTNSGKQRDVTVVPFEHMESFSTKTLEDITGIVFLYHDGSSAKIAMEKRKILLAKRPYDVRAEDIAAGKFICKDNNGTIRDIKDLLVGELKLKSDSEDKDGKLKPVTDTIGEGEDNAVKPGAGQKDKNNAVGVDASGDKDKTAPFRTEEKGLKTGLAAFPAAAVNPLVEKIHEKANISFEEGMNEIVKLLSEKRITEATVLAKALSFLPPETDDNPFAIFYNRLRHAVNMKMDEPDYKGDVVDGLEDSEVIIEVDGKLDKSMHRLLRLSTFAWALLSPRDQDAHYYKKYKSSILPDDSMLSGTNGFSLPVSSLKPVFDILFDLVKISPTGFDRKVMMALMGENEKKNDITSLANKARDMLVFTLPKTKVSGTTDWYDACLGRDSDLGKCINIITNSSTDKKDKDFVVSFMSGFESKALDSAVEDYLDKKWDEVDRSAKGKMKYAPKYNIRTNLSSNVKRRVEVIGDWVAMAGNSNDSIKNIDRIAGVKKELVTEIKNARKKTADSFDANRGKREALPLLAGLAVIDNTFSRICGYLESPPAVHGKWDYIDFHRSHYISLDSDYMPVLNKELQNIKGFEPWRRVLMHTEATGVNAPDFDKALELISNSGEKGWHKNYGTARNIGMYLQEKKGRKDIETDYSAKVGPARKDAEKEIKNFERKIDFAHYNDSINEEMKEDILRQLHSFKEYFLGLEDFAQFTAFLDALITQVDTCSEKRRAELEATFNNLRENDEKGIITEEIAGIIKKVLAKQKYGLAEEYITRIKNGDTDSMKADNYGNEAKTDYLENFLADYKVFYDACDNNRNPDFAVWTMNAMKKCGKIKPKQEKTSEALLKSWPKKDRHSPIKTDVIKFLEYMGFDVVEKNSYNENPNNKYVVITVNVKSSRNTKNSSRSVHPIARFGTGISTPISVVWYAGGITPFNLKKDIQKDSSLKESTFVLVNTAFSIEDRKDLANELKSIDSNSAFLVIDHVLMLYLATLNDSQWLPALLNCTLPYTKCQPYVRGVGTIADEMFFGRQSELDQIRDYNGASLVYGGRKLGKTALLRRACNLENDPANKKYAVFVDVVSKSGKEALQEISKELKDQAKLDMKFDSTEELYDALAAKLSSNEISKFQLYIDEADTFLDAIESDNYKDLNPFIKLRDKFLDRFKVVFAGLHKVVHSAVNSPILQLGDPLAIEPFKPADAEMVVKMPLSYLGLRFDEETDEGKNLLQQMLVNTNYYPGLVQWYCYDLLQSFSKDYEKYCKGQNPPFTIQEEHLIRAISSEKLNDKAKEYFFQTIDLDGRYRRIAHIIAFLHLDYRERGVVHPDGFSREEVMGWYDVYPVPMQANMDIEKFEALLSEMVKMGILFNREGTAYYCLRRNIFLGYLGKMEHIEKEISAAARKKE